MQTLVYVNVAHADRRAFEHFCESSGYVHEALNGQGFRLTLSQRECVQLKLLFHQLQDDFGTQLLGVVGFEDDAIMRLAIEIAEHTASGQLMELADCLWLSVEQKDLRLLEALRNKLRLLHNDLIDTVSMYLSCSNNAVLAAEYLYLHRNTFNYRLDKFHEETKIDVRDIQLSRLLQLYFVMNERLKD